MFQLIINIFLSYSIYIIIAISFSIVYYSTRFFHIAHAVVITAAAYFSYFFSRQLGFNLCIAVPLAIMCATILGLVMELGIYKPLRKRKAAPLIMLITSLGLYVVLQNLISIIWGDNTKNIRTWEVKAGHEIFGAYITDVQISIIIISIVIFIWTLLFIKYSKTGKNIRALSFNKELSVIFGINANYTILWTFGIGSFLAGIAGIIVALDTSLAPTMGFNLLLYGVVAMIIGGVGSTWGLVGGSLLLATAQHLGAYYIDSKWMDAIAYVILIVFLIWRPLGFSGRQLKKIEI
ncbi:High-affinity branched-chain amino acid transport system permease protein LivH [subsurface metagenome]